MWLTIYSLATRGNKMSRNYNKQIEPLNKTNNQTTLSQNIGSFEQWIRNCDVEKYSHRKYDLSDNRYDANNKCDVKQLTFTHNRRDDDHGRYNSRNLCSRPDSYAIYDSHGRNNSQDDYKNLRNSGDDYDSNNRDSLSHINVLNNLLESFGSENHRNSYDGRDSNKRNLDRFESDECRNLKYQQRSYDSNYIKNSSMLDRFESNDRRDVKYEIHSRDSNYRKSPYMLNRFESNESRNFKYQKHSYDSNYTKDSSMLDRFESNESRDIKCEINSHDSNHPKNSSMLDRFESNENGNLKYQKHSYDSNYPKNSSTLDRFESNDRRDIKWEINSYDSNDSRDLKCEIKSDDSNYTKKSSMSDRFESNDRHDLKNEINSSHGSNYHKDLSNKRDSYGRSNIYGNSHLNPFQSHSNVTHSTRNHIDAYRGRKHNINHRLRAQRKDKLTIKKVKLPSIRRQLRNKKYWDLRKGRFHLYGPKDGEPGSKTDPRRRGLPTNGVKWYLRFLRRGMDPDEARELADVARAANKLNPLPKNPWVPRGQPGGKDDPYRQSLTKSGVRWYIRFLSWGKTREEARDLSLPKRFRKMYKPPDKPNEEQNQDSDSSDSEFDSEEDNTN